MTIKLYSALKKLTIVLFILNITTAYAMEVAITVDDLPLNGTLPENTRNVVVLKQMLDAFEKHNIKHVYGLINGEKVLGNKEGHKVLSQWIGNGHLLGSHTFSHLDLAKVDSNEFIENIKKNENILHHFMKNKDWKYFRYPYLASGNTQGKYNTVREFLFENNYRIATVTVDFFEYEWNDPYVRCLNSKDFDSIEWLKTSYLEQASNALVIARELSKYLFNREIKHILIIHINSFTALMLDDLLTMYEKNGVKFISMQDALNDQVYQINPNVIMDRPYTFLNQVRIAKGLPNPEIVKELYDTLPENKLKSICIEN